LSCFRTVMKSGMRSSGLASMAYWWEYIILSVCKTYDDTPSSLGVIQWRQTFPIKTEIFSFGSISWQGFRDLKSTCSIVGLWWIPTAAGFHLVSKTFNPFAKSVKYDDTPSSLGVIQWRQTFPIKTENRNRNQKSLIFGFNLLFWIVYSLRQLSAASPLFSKLQDIWLSGL